MYQKGDIEVGIVGDDVLAFEIFGDDFRYLKEERFITHHLVRDAVNALNLGRHGSIRLEHHRENGAPSGVDGAELYDLGVGILTKDSSTLEIDDDRVGISQSLRRPLFRRAPLR